MSKRSPEQILQDIEDSEFDDVVDQVLAKSPEERRRDLAAAGFDLAKLDEQADALHAKLQHGQTQTQTQQPVPGPAAGAGGGRDTAKVIPLPRRTRRAVWAASLLAAAVGGGTLLMTGTGGVGTSRAEDLRKKAFAACDAHRWDECKRDLDEAKAVEPTSEDDTRVIAARKALREAGH